ncbi:malic enzyme-like protein [Embleya hyalina]|uniref:Malate dehydrogenase n=1 Tax=Embleya hyalina TaxID=516124 RepID=A0A401YCT7_9ACTN|nr:malic enzyme-like protein [Embleya hyalina]GCD92386.1 malate dehydrogenase [Embleya hyalina]
MLSRGQGGAERPAPNPAYSVRIHIPPDADAIVESVLADAPGTVARRADEPDVTGARRITLDADGPHTLAWLTRTLARRLGADLLHAQDPVFTAASTGKLTLRVCAATSTGHDVALLDADADRRVVSHLAAHPEQIDRYTGRGHRVALISDASAVLGFEELPADAVLPALESQAVHLRRATGLDVFPLPVATPDVTDIARAVRILAPGFAAAVLVHTRLDRVTVTHAALGPTPPVLLLDTINDGLAPATAAATVNALVNRGLNPLSARVIVVDPAAGGDLAGLLIACGIADLTLFDPFTHSADALHTIADGADLIVDLTAFATPPPGVPVLRARPDTPPAFGATTTGPRPLHALPGLLTAATATRRPITGHARVAAVYALIENTPRNALLPPTDQPGLTAVVAAAATRALDNDPDPDRG